MKQIRVLLLALVLALGWSTGASAQQPIILIDPSTGTSFDPSLLGTETTLGSIVTELQTLNAGIDVLTLPAVSLAAGTPGFVGSVNVGVGGTVNSATNPLFFRLTDGSSAITVTANPEDEDSFNYGTTQLVPMGCVGESTTDAITDGQVATPNCTLDRRLYVAVGPTVDASAAYTPCYIVTTASTNAANCKASAGNFSRIRAINTTATLAYLRLYNSSGTPTCSSATGFVESIPIPANSAGAGLATVDFPINYSTGIAYCVTGGGSSTDNTNAPAGVYIALGVK